MNGDVTQQGNPLPAKPDAALSDEPARDAATEQLRAEWAERGARMRNFARDHLDPFLLPLPALLSPLGLMSLHQGRLTGRYAGSGTEQEAAQAPERG